MSDYQPILDRLAELQKVDNALDGLRGNHPLTIGDRHFENDVVHAATIKGLLEARKMLIAELETQHNLKITA